MPICKFSDLPNILQPYQCLLGIDPGKKTIGVAIADPMGMVASPLQSIARTKQKKVLAELVEIVHERNIGGIIMGLPKNMDGTEGPSAQSVRTFAASLRQGEAPLPDMPIAFWDERLSTEAVTRMMIDDDMTRKRRAKVVDKAAASYILQGALDAMLHIKEAAKREEE